MNQRNCMGAENHLQIASFNRIGLGIFQIRRLFKILDIIILSFRPRLLNSDQIMRTENIFFMLILYFFISMQKQMLFLH